MAILLQRQSAARRIYATVVHAKSNTDGYKEQGTLQLVSKTSYLLHGIVLYFALFQTVSGITFPNGERQTQLLREVYLEAGINTSNVVYVEAHGTGTKVGDPQEANAVCEVFCRDRTTPLLIGSVKSNMGHAEPSSGLASVAKVQYTLSELYLLLLYL